MGRIGNGMGPYRPKIEELATCKPRREHPALAATRDAASEKERRTRLEKLRDGKAHHRNNVRV